MAVSKRLRYEVLQRDNYTCRYCGAFAPIVRLEVDHVLPRKHHGKDRLENLVTACEDCNRGKSALLPEEWLLVEIGQATQRWRDDPAGEAGEDDYSDVHAYQDAHAYLEELTTYEALHFMARAAIEVMPYRPTHSEQIRLAAKLAREAVRAECR
jgi:hypothetical protein